MASMREKLLFGAALAGLVLANGCAEKKDVTSTSSATATAGECHGINSCKGTGDCGGAGHMCAGKNSCKGKGWLKMTQADCEKKGGQWKPM